MKEDPEEERKRNYNYISYAEIWHEVAEDGKLYTVTHWSSGNQANWESNGVIEWGDNLEFDLIIDINNN